MSADHPQRCGMGVKICFAVNYGGGVGGGGALKYGCLHVVFNISNTDSVPFHYSPGENLSHLQTLLMKKTFK